MCGGLMLIQDGSHQSRWTSSTGRWRVVRRIRIVRRSRLLWCSLTRRIAISRFWLEVSRIVSLLNPLLLRPSGLLPNLRPGHPEDQWKRPSAVCHVHVLGKNSIYTRDFEMVRELELKELTLAFAGTPSAPWKRNAWIHRKPSSNAI